jgi:hypothetical protein
MYRLGQNYIYIYTVYILYFWQGDHQVYGHIQCICTVLANLMYLSINVWGKRGSVICI